MATSSVSKTTRVVIVEDDDAIREGLRLIVDGTPGLLCIDTFEHAEALLDADLGYQPGVVLLDIELPGMSGIEAVAPIRDAYPRTEILMQTVYGDEERVFKALCAGASGYLLKNTPPGDLVEAVQEVAQGGAPMTPSIARKVVGYFQQAAAPDEDPLTDREEEVLEHLVDGKTNRQIGEALFISPNTVAYHVKQIYDKLHVHSRAEAVAKALRRDRTLGR